MNCVAPIKDESWRDRHGQRCDAAYFSAYQRLELEHQPNTNNAHKYDGQPQRPQVPPKQALEKQQDVKVKRSVVIGRVVPVKSVLYHLIDEPSVDALIKVRRLHPEQEKAQEYCEP